MTDDITDLQSTLGDGGTTTAAEGVCGMVGVSCLVLVLDATLSTLCALDLEERLQLYTYEKRGLE